MALSFLEAKQMSIVDYLYSQGYEPAKIKGHDYWYYSPLRNERTPSLKVNSTLNIWYDHGLGEGGTILDLGARLNHCTLYEFLNQLSGGHVTSKKNIVTSSASTIKTSKLEIISIKELANDDLLRYLKSRKIKEEVYYKHCKEVTFDIKSKRYCAIGFLNRSGGYELRNRWFKGSSSPKDVAIIANDNSRLSVVEGFMDYLSLLSLPNSRVENATAHSDFLILNSLSLLHKNLQLLTTHKNVSMFLDNDSAGKDALVSLASKGIEVHDASTFYADYKDVNDFLMKCQDLPHVKTMWRGL